MEVISVRNVHQALPEALYRLKYEGEAANTRNGPVVRFKTPVTTVYEKPMERVIFWPQRDANPFFHVAESLWMLAGRNDIALPSYFVKRMKTFSDDGVTLHAAYGHRWRVHFGQDQLRVIARRLQKDPTDRRCVLTMWDPKADLDFNSRDLPCNTQVYFKIKDGRLDMTVTNRSNDIIWGAYGANAVHLSFLQEYMAICIGCGVGRYWQVSNDFHAYEDTLNTPVGELWQEASDPVKFANARNPYSLRVSHDVPLFNGSPDVWDSELRMFLDEPVGFVGLRSNFLRRVASPIFKAYALHKSGQTKTALEVIEAQCLATDWKVACSEWLQRRLDRKKDEVIVDE